MNKEEINLNTKANYAEFSFELNFYVQKEDKALNKEISI